MKKLLGSTLALSMFFPGSTVSAAELLKNLKFGGQIDLQSTSASNVTDFTTRNNTNGNGTPAANAGNNRIGDAQTRIMLHMDWDVLDDVHAKFTLRKNDRTYGSAGGVSNPGVATNSQPIQATAAGNVLGNIFVDQAYFKIDKLGGSIDATMGRQFYGTSGDMVAYFGPSDKALYGLQVTAIDAVRADWSNDMLGVTGVVGKLTGHPVGVAAVGTGVGDVDLRGINVMLKGHENMNLGAYLWDRVTHRTGATGAPATTSAEGGKNDNLWVVGVKTKVTMGMAWIAAEGAKNFGENRGLITNDPAVAGSNNARYTGWAAKLDLGAKADLGGIGSVSPWLHFGYGSGDTNADGKNHTFTPIASDYRPGSIYGRFAVATGANGTSGTASLGSASGAAIASNSLGNRRILGLGVKTTPSAMNKLTAGLSWWDYSFATNPGPALGSAKHIGCEADLDLNWAHSENVSLGAGVGQFWPGAVVKTAIQSNAVGAASALSQRGVNPAKLAYFDVRVKF